MSLLIYVLYNFQSMRLPLCAIAALVLAGCGGKTPSCTDKVVTAEVRKFALQAISDGLLKNDLEVRLDQIMSRINVTLTDVKTTEYNKGIDKHTCTGALHVTLPAEIATLNDYRAFQTLALGGSKVNVVDNDIVAPITFTSYMSEQDEKLIVYSEGDNIPANFVRGAHKVGAFDADLSTLPDLRTGLTLYSTTAKNVLIEPADNGALKFHINHQSHMCRSWTQFITDERGDMLVYDNPEVGCSVYFSRLGQILVVEHKGCNMMAEYCHPDGIYQKQ